jgi:hypothetical protein
MNEMLLTYRRGPVCLGEVVVVARSRQVCIYWVVEALLVVYLTEERADIYRYKSPIGQVSFS